MRIQFADYKIRQNRLDKIELVNGIIEEYTEEGYTLTLRQLYYQLVSRDIIPNKPSEYDVLGDLIVDGRMLGLIDWDSIEDRVRVPHVPGSWESPAEILKTAHDGYRVDRMKGQPNYLEVWTEKDAISGVLKPITNQYGISITVNRGYASTTALYDAYNRISEELQNGKYYAYILYLGDHDPIGKDMINDIIKRINQFHTGSGDNIERFESRFSVEPIAITFEQIRRYNPPPNPAKLSDGRAKWYIENYGPHSWEVDALKPEVLASTLKEEIESRIDVEIYQEMRDTEKEHKRKLKEFINQFEHEQDGDDSEQDY